VAFQVVDGAITWTCRVCGSDNGLELVSCAVCGAPLAATLRPPESPGPRRDPGTTAMMSLFFPGAGHAYVGLWGPAIARAVTATWVLSVALLSALQGGLGSPAAMVFGLVSFGLWIVCCHDAYREAAGERGAVILGDRYLIYLVLALLVLSFATVFLTALGARR
jgi:hypothetical protein